jgi:hypothetical protein
MSGSKARRTAFGILAAVFARIPGTEVAYPGSGGVGWGVVAPVGGVAFVAVAEWEARRWPVVSSSAASAATRVEAPAGG